MTLPPDSPEAAPPAATEQRLREEVTRARRQLVEAIEAISEGFVLYDAEDRLVLFNARYKRDYSFTPDLLVPGIRYEDILRAGMDRGLVPRGTAPEDWFAQRLADHREPGPPRLIQRPDGRWVRMTEYRTQEGGIVGIRTDVTAIMERERALSDARDAASEVREQLREAIEAMDDGLVLYDPQDRLVLWNSFYKDRLDLTPDLLEVGRTYEERFRAACERGTFRAPPGRLEEFVAERVHAHRELRHGFEYMRSDGMRIRVNEYRTRNGGIVAIHSDVTAEHARQRALRQSRRLLRAVIDSVPAIINVKDRESRYVLMNRFQGEVYGIDPAEAVGKTSVDLVGPDYGGTSRAMDIQVVTTGQPLPFTERDFVDVRGRAHTWFTAKMPLKDEQGLVQNVVTVALDITMLKTTERARANLARYFPPNMITTLAAEDDPFGPARSESVAVLFADIIGFTHLCEELPPAHLFDTLRQFQRRLGQHVFDCQGTLDKYTGDGMMATFGTPRPGPQDATNALRCAVALQRELRSWNAERYEAGEREIQIGVGVHYGPALLGNIGDERRLEFAVVGDTVNVASRLEKLGRLLETQIVVSEALMARVRAESPGGEAAARGFLRRGEQSLAGREAPVEVWTACLSDLPE